MTAVATSSGFEPVAASAFLLQPDHWALSGGHPHYWPSGLLATFMLQMAAQGNCVSESMMLGSRVYAIEKLAYAHTLDDADLREIAVRMFSYFDDEPVHAVTLLVGGSLSH